MATKAATKPTTAVAVKKSSAIVSIQDQLRKQAEEMAGKVAPASGITIGITQAKEFKFPDGTKSDSFEGVIVDFVSANYFYEGAYDPNNISPPACFAIGSNPLQLVPSPNAPLAQAAECKSCPMNEFGSAGKGKACKNQRLLAVLPASGGDEQPIWLLKVSPTALKAFDGYVRSVATALQLPPVGVVTTFSFDENSDYASVRFSNPMPNPMLAEHFARQDEARKLLATEPDTSTYTAAVPTPAARRPGAAPAAKKVARR